MTLQFVKQINEKPTYFIEKIWQSLPDELASGSKYFINGYIYKHYQFSDDAPDMLPKLHTIRFLSPKMLKQWQKKDRVIHFKQWSGKPYASDNIQFAPVIPVQSLQKVTFDFAPTKTSPDQSIKFDRVFITLGDEVHECLFINGHLEHYSFILENMIINDGFESITDFFKYFTKERIIQAKKQGKKPYIIHWTKLKY